MELLNKTNFLRLQGAQKKDEEGRGVCVCVWRGRGREGGGGGGGEKKINSLQVFFS